MSKIAIKRAMVALGIAGCLALSGCSNGRQAVDDAKTVESSDTGRFAIANGGNTTYTNDYSIIVDTETGVQYVWIYKGSQIGVAFPLYNADGTVSRIEE